MTIALDALVTRSLFQSLYSVNVSTLILHYIPKSNSYTNFYFRLPGRGVRSSAGDAQRGDVRPERVGHASDGARARVVRRHRAHGVRRQRRHLLRHRAHAHSRT